MSSLQTKIRVGKGSDYYWSEIDSGPVSLLETLQEHYSRLSGTYRLKGMEQEASLFASVVLELKKSEAELKMLRSYEN
jgi:hypothetical protein